MPPSKRIRNVLLATIGTLVLLALVFCIVSVFTLRSLFAPRWYGFLFFSNGGYLFTSHETETECVQTVKEKMEQNPEEYVSGKCGFEKCGDGWDDIAPNCRIMIDVQRK